MERIILVPGSSLYPEACSDRHRQTSKCNAGVYYARSINKEARGKNQCGIKEDFLEEALQQKPLRY